MLFEDKLFHMGITTFTQDVVTAFPEKSASTFQIGKILSTDVGYIYGISMYADSVDQDNIQLITTTQAQNTYALLKNGTTDFEQIRLDDFLNVFAGSPNVRTERYMRVSIPYFDLSKSEFKNPTGINSTAFTINIRLKFYFIQKRSFKIIREIMMKDNKFWTSQDK